MRVLVVKLSSLGDVVHSLASVMDMRQAMPDASIDWVVEDGFAPLLQTCPAVDRVIPCRLRRWRKQWWTADTRQEWRTFMSELHAVKYDAVIDLQGLSKSALISRLTSLSEQGKRYAMANRTRGSAYERPTRWVADELIECPWDSHAVQRARHVCSHALGYNESYQGIQTMFIEPDPSVAPRTLALVHGTSRADKCWPLNHWMTLARQLTSMGFQLALPHSNDAEERVAMQVAQSCAGSVVWPRSDIFQLSRRLAACVGVIGVDSGPSHMAVALGLPHVQIYNFDTAWRTGPQHCDWQQSVFAQPQPSPEVVMHTWLDCLRAHENKAGIQP